VASQVLELLSGKDRLEFGHHGIRQCPHLLLRALKRLGESGRRALHDLAYLSPLLLALRLHRSLDELDDSRTRPDPGDSIHAPIMQHSADQHADDDSEDQHGQEKKG
jgi:hypothetical protein